MPDYGSLTLLRSRYGESRLTLITPVATGQTEATYWAQHLSSAQLEVDGYLRRSGYAVPLSDADYIANKTLLDSLTVDLALEYGQTAKSGEANPVAEAATRARARLSEIAAGKFRLSMPIVDPSISGGSTDDEFQDSPGGHAHPFRKLGGVVNLSRRIPG